MSSTPRVQKGRSRILLSRFVVASLFFSLTPRQCQLSSIQLLKQIWNNINFFQGCFCSPLWRSRWVIARIERSANGFPKRVLVEFSRKTTKAMAQNQQVLRSLCRWAVLTVSGFFGRESSCCENGLRCSRKLTAKFSQKAKNLSVLHAYIRAVAECWRHNFGGKHGFGCGFERSLSFFSVSVTNSFFLRWPNFHNDQVQTIRVYVI